MVAFVNISTSGFCRDCLGIAKGEARRCEACGSPRMLRHGELDRLSIAHIDCDAFYASVEKRDDPTLIDKPVIIGGGKRGVVSTACYVARIHGVRSAMPMFKALDLCPQAVVIKPNMEKYSRVGREVRTLMLEMTPLVEPVSIDEAFLDLSGTELLHHSPPAFTLAKFARRVQSEIGITVSVGLSYCKFLAKIASDMEKPRGFSVIGQQEAPAYLAALPVSKIWGVGKAFEASLQSDGITMIGQLQTMDETALMKRYGVMGQRLYRLSRGLDTRKVDPSSDMKSVSAETTFMEDLSGLSDLRPVLRALSEKVAKRLKRGEIAGRTVVLKLKTKDFKGRTRNRTLSDPTQLADRIFRTGLELLEKEIDGTKFRLIGIGVSDLSDPTLADPQDLVDVQATKRAKVEGAMDKLRDKFGRNAVELGETFGKRRRD
ncbi:MAG: DNA polymerase IV [Rhizobiaceae bacterium]